MSNIFFSDRIGHDKLRSTNDLTYGRANYSWLIISRLYREGLTREGYVIRDLVRPETYQSEISRGCLLATGADIHLAIKPIEELRPLHGVRNVYVCGWEFPEISDKDYGINPFFNQVRVLQRADHLMCWSDFTTENMKRAGLSQAITLPPPILEPKLSGPVRVPPVPTLTLDTHARPGQEQFELLDKVLESVGTAKLFVSVLNPYDDRKNLGPLLSGFVAALEREADAYLIVKLVIDNVGTTVGNINEILRTYYDLALKSSRVVFVGTQLTDDEMRQLLAAADFYLCAPTAEGLNLPLISALRQGKPAVSTWNSAMKMYLDRDCSIEIRGKEQSLVGKGHVLAEHFSVTQSIAEASDITDGIREALLLDMDRYASMARAAEESAERHFGQAAFAKRFGKMLASSK